MMQLYLDGDPRQPWEPQDGHQSAETEMTVIYYDLKI